MNHTPVSSNCRNSIERSTSLYIQQPKDDAWQETPAHSSASAITKSTAKNTFWSKTIDWPRTNGFRTANDEHVSLHQPKVDSM